MINRSSYFRLKFYIAKEFITSFAVSFLFYFFIFFVNQILVLVRKVMLKNVDTTTMLILVISSIPQFLQYVIPFATLTASAMILGNLASSNELLAMRSLGIPIRKIFRVLIITSILLSLVTLYIADYLLPTSSKNYKTILAKVMRELPTFELSENGVNSVGPIVLSNGRIDQDTIEDIILISDQNGNKETLSAKEGRLSLIDTDRYIYELALKEPRMFIHEKNINNWMIADSDDAVLYMDFSKQIPALTSDSPGNRSSQELLALIGEKRETTNRDRLEYHKNRENKLISILKNLSLMDSPEAIDKYENEIKKKIVELEQLGPHQPTNYHLKYYSAELNKKFALSFACFALTVLSLAIGSMRMRHGKLLGFGIAILSAVVYWYFLFACQIGVFRMNFNAGILMWVPDLFCILLGLIILFFRRRNV
ncbi:MAG: LptF/LptG family permease [Sphaerochaetaceae bacterium]|nr:LptF/LptG family permease [Sphaerochaetaceae bacterium]